MTYQINRFTGFTGSVLHESSHLSVRCSAKGCSRTTNCLASATEAVVTGERANPLQSPLVTVPVILDDGGRPINGLRPVESLFNSGDIANVLAEFLSFEDTSHDFPRSGFG